VTWVRDVSDGEHCPEVITRTYRATDVCGNWTTCTQKITINDITAPSISCLDPVTIECGEQIPVTSATANDNCDTDVEVMYVDSDPSGNCPKVITRTFTAMDDCGNTKTCTQYIYIEDTTPPSINCSEDVTIECGEQLPITSAGVSDICDQNVSLTGPFDSEPTGFCPRIIVRTYYATDACLNQSSCTIRIYIEDTTGPSLTCPDPVTIECGDPLPQGGNALVSDCSPLQGPVTFTDSEPEGPICEQVVTRKYSAVDICGNVTTCTQYIYIEDTTAPTITCPDNVTIGCQDQLPAPSATADDICDPSVDVSYVDEMLGDNTACQWVVLRRYTATDACLNATTCLQYIFIQDMTPPMLSCPADRTIECGDPVTDMATATDDCDEDVFVTLVDEDIVDGECTSTITRTYQAWDACGQTATCQQVITVEDNTAPEVLCEDVTIECDEKHCLTFDDIGVNNFASPVIIDSVVEGGVTVHIKAYRKGGIQISAALYNTNAPHPNDLDLGTPNVLYGGPGINSDDPYGYNINNNQAAGNAIIVQTPGSPVPDDYLLSDSLVFIFSEPVFMESFIGVDFELPQVNTGAGMFMYDENNVLLSFTPFNAAVAGNNTLEEVTLRMNRVKRLKVYYGTIVPSSGGVAKLCFVTIPDPEVADCSESIVTSEESMNVIDDCVTEIERTYSATDVCGNANEEACTQLITLETDSHQPDIICPADINLACEDPIPSPDASSVAATDDCSAEEDIVVEWVQDVVTGCGCSMVIKRIYQATDECGNRSRCVQFITRTQQVELAGKLFLSGPLLSSGNMSNALRTANLVPNNQPYNYAPYNYGGSESMVVLPSNTVDWVLITLRDQNTQAVVATRAAILLSDGHLIDTDGSQTITFNAPPDMYYVAVHHRNHLDFITDGLVDFTTAMANVDFSTLGDAGMVYVTPQNVYAMIKGDVNKDHLVKYNGSNNDKNAILAIVGITTPNNVVAAYSPGDVNMDGLVKYNGSNNDKNAVLSTVGLLTPNNVVVGDFF
jgi:hypothetical protein